VLEVVLNSKGKYAVLLLSSVLVIYAIIGGMLGRVSAQNGSYQQLSIFMEVLSRIQNDYVDEPSIKNAVNGAIRGLLENVDPYAGYLSPQEVAFYKAYSPYKTPGIGAVLAKRFGYPVIVSVIPGGPAARAKLGTGDMIESIDGVTTREMNLVQVNALLANPTGKPVALSVIKRRTTEPEAVTLPREATPAPAVEAKIIETNIAYVKVPYLAPGKAQEARRQLDGLLQKGARNVILDLRYTAGGEEAEAVALANLFLDSGTITYVQGQKYEKKVLQATPKDALTKAPLVVLVNQGTSGAGEIVAGAIGDNRRGQLVGVKTFGSGSVQRLMPLENGSALLLSVAKYYTPSGKEIQQPEAQLSGIKPTIEVLDAADEVTDPNEDDEFEQQPEKKDEAPAVDEDRQLNKAIEFFKDPLKATRANKAA
jgi:carboxyl-terminal processing protease